MRRIPRKTLGLICLLTTSVIWVISSFISSYLVKEDGANKSAKISPLLLTYLATSLFSVYLPLIALRVWYQRVAKPFLDKRVFRR